MNHRQGFNDKVLFEGAWLTAKRRQPKSQTRELGLKIDPKIKIRLAWVRMYHQTKNAGVVCRRCGISRPTLRKWVRRYQELGLEGLKDQSRRPKTYAPKKIFPQQTQWILGSVDTTNATK